MPLRVFVSHSSQEDQAVLTAIADAIKARNNFSLLMDTELLDAGDPWRARINLWLGGCDAAVLVLSEKALESPWVVYEASVLSYRNRGGNFLIIPVLLRDPQGKLLSDRRLDAQHIKETQAIISDDVAAIAQRVVAALPEHGGDRPIDAIVKQFSVILDTVPAALLQKAADKLHTQLPWEPGEDPAGVFVEKLLGAPTRQAAAALFQLSSHFKKDSDRMEEMVNLVAASWINPKALTLLPEVSQAISGRAVALNAEYQDTAEIYHLAASGGDLTWHFIRSGPDAKGNGNSEPIGSRAEEIRELVEQDLCAHLHCTKETLQQELEDYAAHTFVVGIAAEGFTDALIEELQQSFPLVTFFFITGSHAPPAAAVERRLITRITPDLVKLEEEELKSNRSFLKKNVVTAQKMGPQS
jgi:hypothetical protein